MIAYDNPGDSSPQTRLELCQPPLPQGRPSVWAKWLAPAFFALALLLTTSVPFAVGEIDSHGRYFPGATTNVADYGVYLTWIALAMHGHWIDPHLFTNTAPHGELIDPVYGCIGVLAALLHLSLPAAYQLGRLLLCAGFAFTAWWLTGEVFGKQSVRVRTLSMGLICFSSGIGWMLPWHGDGGSIDTWQPEAITFLGLYTFPHFAASLILISSMYCLLLKAERTRKLGYAAGCGLCGALLTLVHPYDIVTIAVAGVFYLLLRAVAKADIKASASNLIVAAAITLPSFAYIAYSYKHDPVLAASDLPLPTAPFLSVVDGYGLVFVLACIGALISILALHSRNDKPAAYFDRDTLITVSAWCLATFAAIYLPLHFQCRLIEGGHIPLCLLGAVGIDWVLGKLKLNGKFAFSAAAFVLCAFLSVGNWAFMARDLSGIQSGNARGNRYRSYISAGELAALQWLNRNAPQGATIQPLPWIGNGTNGMVISDVTLQSYVPAFTLNPEFVGHWTLSPNYRMREQVLIAAVAPDSNPTEQAMAFRSMGIDYLIFSQKTLSDTIADRVFPSLRGKEPLPSYLKLVYSNPDVDVYRVQR